MLFRSRLRTSGIRCQYVRIICAGREGAESKIEINGKEAGAIRIAGISKEETHAIPIPEEMRNSDLITVRILNHGDEMSPKFYETRLIKE